jgi:hypothetical protein
MSLAVLLTYLPFVVQLTPIYCYIVRPIFPRFPSSHDRRDANAFCEAKLGACSQPLLRMENSHSRNGEGGDTMCTTFRSWAVVVAKNSPHRLCSDRPTPIPHNVTRSRNNCANISQNSDERSELCHGGAVYALICFRRRPCQSPLFPDPSPHHRLCS